MRHEERRLRMPHYVESSHHLLARISNSAELLLYSQDILYRVIRHSVFVHASHSGRQSSASFFKVNWAKVSEAQTEQADAITRMHKDSVLCASPVALQGG